MARLVLVSNRVPAPGDRGARAGGLATALSDAVNGGVWFGWSGEVAAKTDTESAPNVKRHKGVTYVTVDLSEDEYEKYYVGFSNSTLWPLMHFRLGLMEFDRALYRAYCDVSTRLARALKPFLQPDDVIWVHDYHLIPFGRALRELGVHNRIGFFLHVPFVPPSVFEILPSGEELLSFLTSYDLVGVQTATDLRNLLDCIRKQLDLDPDPHGRVVHRDKPTRFNCYPIGIDSDQFAEMSVKSFAGAETSRLRQSLAGRALIMGVDRLDYSKGLPQRFEAYTRLLAGAGGHLGKVTYLQIAARSRDDVPQYRQIQRELDRMSGRINGRFGTVDWVPLRYITRAVPRATLAGYYRLARVGLVTPLRDGMNLVAKEYVAAQDPDDPGVLVLSPFAGAVHELFDALVVNPFDPDALAEAMDQALRMPLDERQARWKAMWARIHKQDAAAWRTKFLEDLQV